jgi:uncharacterized protein (DUF427 family)
VGPLRPLLVEASAGHARKPVGSCEPEGTSREDATMKAIWRGRVIAESERTLEVDGYRYFPRDSVRMELLQAAPETPDDRV